MTDCKHDRIQTWRIEDGTPAGLWSCVDCAVKFVPMSELEREKASRQAAQIENEDLKARIARSGVEQQRAVLAEQPAPPECQTEAEKRAYAFGWFKAMEAERAALAEQSAEQEPVAWVVDMNGTESLEWHSDVQADLIFGTAVQPLYTAPYPAKREPLTDEEIRDLWSWSMTHEAERTATTQQHAFARAVIAAYERKNGITGETQ